MRIANIFSRVDWQLMIPTTILVFLSLVTLFSVDRDLFWHQLIFAVLSFCVFLFFSQLDIEALEDFVVPIYIVSLVLLLLVLGFRLETRGAVRWIDILGFRIQFSEIIKPFLIVCLAALLDRQKGRAIITLGKIICFSLPILLLIYRQPDLGSTLVYLGVIGITLLVYGFPLWWFGIGGVALVSALPLLWTHLHQYQRDRVLSFFHITNDFSGTSWNAGQALIAVGSGMFWGKGLGLGTQSALKFLPERSTDFLFATLSEDLGFVGAALVIAVFIWLFVRLFVIFMQTQKKYEKTIIGASFALLFIQFFANIGMNIGILPIVGITLPMMSYGGSSLLSNAILLGLVSSIGSATKRKNVLIIQ